MQLMEPTESQLFASDNKKLAFCLNIIKFQEKNPQLSTMQVIYHVFLRLLFLTQRQPLGNNICCSVNSMHYYVSK